jgi:uracil DNA glycosylase
MTIDMTGTLRTKYVLPTGREVISTNMFYTCPNNDTRIVLEGQDYYMKKQYTEHFVDGDTGESVTQSVIMLTSFQLLQEVM